MTIPGTRSRRRCAATVVVLIGVVAASGCGLIPTRDAARPTNVYVLRAVAMNDATAPGEACGSLRVEPPQPAPGYLTSRMIYMRAPHRLEHFAWSRWADTPTSLLEPLIMEALEDSGAFAAVVAPPAPVDHDLSLVVDNVRLLQRFGEADSDIELSADMRLFQPGGRRLLGSERVTVIEPASAATPEEGVAAANRAAQRFLERLVEFAKTGSGRADGLCRRP